MIRIPTLGWLVIGLAFVQFFHCQVEIRADDNSETEILRAMLLRSRAQHLQLQNELDELRKQLVAERQERDRVHADLLEKIDSLQAALAKETRVRLAKPIGKVTWVNQKAKTIWINLGSLDKIAREHQFHIRSGNLKAQGEEKGMATVTRILDKHLSEARILKQSPENPILPGDQLFQFRVKAKEAPEDGEKVNTETAEVGPKVDGTVVAVSNDGQHVEVTLGEDDGLREGMQLELFRVSEKKYLGRIEILKTKPNRSIGRILSKFKKGEIRKGDRVTNKFSSK